MTKTIDIWLHTQQFPIIITVEANKPDKIQTKLHAPTIIIILLCIFRVKKKTKREVLNLKEDSLAAHELAVTFAHWIFLLAKIIKKIPAGKCDGYSLIPQMNHPKFPNAYFT